MVDQKTPLKDVSLSENRKGVIKSCLYVTEDESVESVAVISKQLEDLGYRVLQANDVSSAKKICQMNFFSLIVLEGCKDEDFVREIKCKDSCNEQTPVLYIASGTLPDMIKDLMQEQFLDEVVFKCPTLESDLVTAVSQLTSQQGNFAITPRSKRTESAVKKKKAPNTTEEVAGDHTTTKARKKILPSTGQTPAHGNCEATKENNCHPNQANSASQLEPQAYQYGRQILPDFRVPMNAAYQTVDGTGQNCYHPASFTLDGTTLRAIAAGAAEFPQYLWPGPAPLPAMALQPFVTGPEMNYQLQPQNSPTLDGAAASVAAYPNQVGGVSATDIKTSENKTCDTSEIAVVDETAITETPITTTKNETVGRSRAKKQKISQNQIEEMDSKNRKTGKTSPRDVSTSDSRKRKSVSHQEKLNRKKAHLDLEKRRRERITKCWHWLRQIIPFCDQSADKATVFEMTVAYIYHCWKYHGDILPDICKEFEFVCSHTSPPDDLDEMVEDILKQEAKAKDTM